MKSTDLFPETLLVDCADGRTYTTSLKIAEHFGKQHQHVLRNIGRIIADCSGRESKIGPTITAEAEFCRLNFQPSTRDVPGPKGAIRQEIIYHLTEEAFALLAMGFTGKEALRWKIAFLDAFRAMEAQLRRQTEREAAALYQLRPRWLPIARNPGLPRQQLLALTGHAAPGSITACRRRMRDAGLLDA